MYINAKISILIQMDVLPFGTELFILTRFFVLVSCRERYRVAYRSQTTCCPGFTGSSCIGKLYMKTIIMKYIRLYIEREVHKMSWMNRALL